MSSKPSKWLFDVKRQTAWTELESREFSVTGCIFTYVQKYFMALLRGGIAPMDPSLTGISEQVVYMLTTSGCQVDFASSTLCGSLWKTRFHTRKLRPTSCPSMNKSEVQSRLASGTSLLKLIAKTLRYQDASFPAWNCQLAHRTVPSFCYAGDRSSTQFNKEYYGRRCLIPLSPHHHHYILP